jgi:dephospho-CoA kinase
VVTAPAGTLVVGVTGSIGMGKTTTARMFARLGYPVFDADAVVHKLYAEGGAAVPLIACEFPAAVPGAAVDRRKLSTIVAGAREALAKLEAIVHPLVRIEEQEFLKAARGAGHRLAILDIPLLFETGREKDVDAVIVASAPEDVQKARVLARPGMTLETFGSIIARQLPDSEKCRRADFVVDTSQGLDMAFEQVRGIVDELLRRDAPL